MRIIFITILILNSVFALSQIHSQQTINSIIKSKNYNKAIKYINHNIENDTIVYSYSYFNLAICYNELRKDSIALENINKAIEIDSAMAHLFAYRGFLENNLGNNEKAIADYNYAINLNPYNGNNYLPLGKIHKNLEQYDKALEVYNKAIKLNLPPPLKSDFYLEIGKILKIQEDYKKALMYFSQAIDSDSKNGEAYWRRGVILADVLKENKAACQDFKKCVMLNYNALYSNMRINLICK